MASDEKHRDEFNEALGVEQAHKLKREAEERKKNTVRKMNNWWLWFGVLILIVILVWWLFSMGLAEDSAGIINGN